MPHADKEQRAQDEIWSQNSKSSLDWRQALTAVSSEGRRGGESLVPVLPNLTTCGHLDWHYLTFLLNRWRLGSRGAASSFQSACYSLPRFRFDHFRFSRGLIVRLQYLDYVICAYCGRGRGPVIETFLANHISNNSVFKIQSYFSRMFIYLFFNRTKRKCCG